MLLLDDNLSPKLVSFLRDVYPDMLHLQDIGLQAGSDNDIWMWAKTHRALICTKDSDFYHQAILYGPPKVIWLRLGNCFTSDIARELRENHARIQRFAADDDEKILILGSSR